MSTTKERKREKIAEAAAVKPRTRTTWTNIGWTTKRNGPLTSLSLSLSLSLPLLRACIEQVYPHPGGKIIRLPESVARAPGIVLEEIRTCLGAVMRIGDVPS